MEAGEGSQSINCQNSHPAILFNAVIDAYHNSNEQLAKPSRPPQNDKRQTFFPGLQQALLPLYLSPPPHALPPAYRCRTVYKPISANVISVRDNRVVFAGVQLFADTEEPGAAVRLCAVLLPGAEVVSPGERFPAGSPDWEVVLASEELFGFPVVAVPKVCGVDITNV
jgi:hypothetical protein